MSFLNSVRNEVAGAVQRLTPITTDRAHAAVMRDLPSEQEHFTSNGIGNEFSESMEPAITFYILWDVENRHVQPSERRSTNFETV